MIAFLFTSVITLLILAWWFGWKKKYYVQIESVGSDADGIVQVFKTQLEITLTEAQEMAKRLPALVKGGNFLNARSVVKTFKQAGAEAKIKYYPVWSHPLGKEEEEPLLDENGKEIKRPSSDEIHLMGIVDLTQEEIDAITNPKATKAATYAKLAEAIQIGGEMLYPDTKEKTEQMDTLLDESEKAAAGVKDPEYFKALKKMRGIVGWSARRHFNFSWLIIFASLLPIGYFLVNSMGMGACKFTAKENMKAIKAWPAKDTISFERATVIMDSLGHYDAHKLSYASPNLYRAYQIRYKKEQIESSKKAILQLQKNSRGASEQKMKGYQEMIEESEKEIVTYTEEIKECQAWDEKDAKKAAIKESKRIVKETSGAARMGTFFSIFFILLIPLYIFANHSWGYVITKTRKEASILNKINQWVWGIAGGMFGLSLFIPTLRTGGSGGGLSSNDGVSGFNALMIAGKIILFVLAFLLIAFASFFILLYSTFVGLKRNYDWKAILSGGKNANA